MNNHIIPYFEKMGIRLCDVKAKTLNEYYLTKIKDGLSPTTVKHHHQNISSALSEAVVKELLQINPATTAFSKKIKSSNLPYVRLHDLRHSTASNLLSMNHSVVEVQEWMGHSSPNTTLAYYSHIHPSESKNRIGIELSDKLTLTKAQQTE